MLLYVNPDLQLVVEQPLSRQPLAGIKIPRGKAVPIWLQFCRNGVIYDPTFTQTSGSLTVGNIYKIKLFVAGDSFTNVGAASNATGQYFTATGTTPTTWTNGSTLVRVDSSGNEFSARWTVKENGKHDQTPLIDVSGVNFAKVGTGTSTVFKAWVDYQGAALNTLLGVNPTTTTDDVTSVLLMAEVSWEGAEKSKTLSFPHRLRNDVLKEGTDDTEIEDGGPP